MNRFELSQILEFCAIATTFWLCLGLVGAWWHRTRPARAHFILFLSIVGCLALPLAYGAARRWNLGLMPTLSPSVSQAQTGRSGAGEQRPRTKDLPEATADTAAVAQVMQGTASSAAGPRTQNEPASGANNRSSKTPEARSTTWTWPGLALGIWIAMSVALSARMALSLLSAARVLSRSRQLLDPTIQKAIDSARGYLGIETQPDVRSSAEMESPAIWCWSRRPTLLIPAALLSETRSMHWESLFCHELSHWRRLDHLTSLMGELALIVFPWHPLVWLAKEFLRHFCELACDGWVIAAGHSRYDYAQNLLSLAVQPNSIAVLPAVSTKRGLRARIDQVVNGSVPATLMGRTWSCGMSSMLLVMTLILALLQSPTASSQQAAPKPDGSAKEGWQREGRPSAGMTARRVETGATRIYWGPAVSSNGRYFCGFSYGYDFYVGETATGKMQKIFEAAKEDFYGSTSVWSPNSERILLSDSRKVLLYVLTTGEKEVFWESPPLIIHDWSSDGDSLVATKSPDSGGRSSESSISSLSVISFRTKAIRELEAVKGNPQAIKPTFSPDGKKLLYATTTSSRSTLHVRSLDGKWRLDFDEFLGRIESPKWSDDGQYIIFKGGQVGSIDLLALRYENDQIVGFPALIRPDARNVELLNRVQNGQLAYKLLFEGGLYTLPMDPAAAKPVGKLRKIFQGGWDHSWSADGKKLARILSPMQGENYLVTFAADSGQLLKRIPLPSLSLGQFRIGNIWTDDNTVLIGTASGTIGRGFYQVRIDSGNIEPVMAISLSDLGPFGYFSVGAKNRVAIGGSAKGIHVVDIVEKKTILTLPKQPAPNERYVRQAISADGEWISFQQMGGRGKLWVASVKDGNARVLYDFSKIDHTLNIHSWCPNGKYISAIAFPKRGDGKAGGDNELWMVPVDGREPFQIPLPTELGESWYPQWSPDGTQLAIHFFSGEDQYWVMQNYIPKTNLQPGGP